MTLAFKNRYFVYGDEPLQHKEAIDAIRARVQQEGFCDRDVFHLTASFNMETLSHHLKTPNLFAEKRLVECYLNEGKMSKSLGDTLGILANLPVLDDTVLLVSASSIDSKTKKTKGFLALEQKSVTLQARALSKSETFVWIQKAFANTGLSLEPSAKEFLFLNTEGHLLAAYQVIEKLKLCFNASHQKPLSIIDIQPFLKMDTRFNIYQFADAALGDDIHRTLLMLESLKTDGIDPILVLWVITKEIRLIARLLAEYPEKQISTDAFRRKGVFSYRENTLKKFIKRVTPQQLQTFFIKAKETDDRIKGRLPGSPWALLQSLCLTLIGTPLCQC